MVLRAELDLAICKRPVVGRKVWRISHVHTEIAVVLEDSQTRYVGSANLSSASAGDMAVGRGNRKAERVNRPTCQ